MLLTTSDYHDYNWSYNQPAQNEQQDGDLDYLNCFEELERTCVCVIMVTTTNLIMSISIDLEWTTEYAAASTEP